ncbi:MAG: FecR family protein [Treponema sp.]|jgi:hypothetical protein|nr:FecR family protein [Treponema sp.]
MIKKDVLLLTAAFFCLPLAAENAVFRTVTGKVEYRISADRQWQPAEKGTEIPQGSDISTGFKSTAALLLNGSVIMVKPLTRMSLDEIARTKAGATTGLYLLSGKVQVEVRPGINTEKTVFKIKSPMSTASVRGTGFVYDGRHLLVNHGSVALQNRFGSFRAVGAGQFAATGNRAAVPQALPVQLPAAPLLTAGGNDTEADQAVQALQSQTAQSSNFSGYVSTYGNSLASGTGADSAETVLQNVLSALGTSKNSAVTIAIH